MSNDFVRLSRADLKARDQKITDQQAQINAMKNMFHQHQINSDRLIMNNTGIPPKNKFDTMRAAMDEARQTMRAADNQAAEMARMLSENGRLKSCPSYVLVKLKRQLRDFNMQTGHWKD